MSNMDFLAEMHYASADPCFAYFDEAEAEHAELVEYASNYEIECDDDYEYMIVCMRKAEDMLRKLRDDDYDAIEHLEEELERAKACLPRVKQLSFQ